MRTGAVDGVAAPRFDANAHAAPARSRAGRRSRIRQTESCEHGIAAQPGAQCSIDEGLVALAALLGQGAKLRQHFVVEINGDARLALDGTARAGRESGQVGDGVHGNSPEKWRLTRAAGQQDRLYAARRALQVKSDEVRISLAGTQNPGLIRARRRLG